MDYNYENLNPERFQEFCQALLNTEYPKIKVFPVGQPDGGRDAIQLLENYPSNQFIVFQIKFIRKIDNKLDLCKWLEGILKRESKKIDKLIDLGAKEFHLITNQNGTAHLETGTIDRVSMLLKKYINIPAYCWWREDINSKLHSKLDLKRSFPELLSTTDLYNIITENSIINSLDLLKKITTFKEQEIKQYLNIDNIPYEEDKDFIGREKQLKEIIKSIRNNRTLHIKSFIFGLGGVGKTALAIQAVHEIKRQNLFPDGIIWYRVRDDELDKIISRFSTLICRAAKIENTINELPSIEEKIDFFKREFKKYKLLFVLDNADNNLDTLIRPLLDILTGFSVILTSRQELTLPSSSHIINLGGLTPDESNSLFKKIIGEKYVHYGSEESIVEICNLVGHLPLAVKLASMYIIEKRILFSDYIKKWKESNERLKLLNVNSTEIEESRRNISICFDLSLNELDDKQKEIFLFMTLFQSNFNITALVDLLPENFFLDLKSETKDSSPNKYEIVNDILSILKKLSLIDRLEGFSTETRIYLHPLIIEFGSEKRSVNLTENESKVHQYYLDIIENNVSVVKSDYQNVQKAIEWKFNRANHKEFIKFSKKIYYGLHKIAFWKLKKQVLEFAYKAAQFLDDKENLAYFLGFIGDIKIRQNDYSGYSDIQKAIEICENEITIRNVKNISDLSNNYLFFKYLLCGEYNIDYHTQLLRASDATTLASYHKFKNANISFFISCFREIYNHIGDFSEARRLAHLTIREYDLSSKSQYHFNWALALQSWLNNIVINRKYLYYLDKVAAKIFEVANRNEEFDILIEVAIPCLLSSLIYKNEFKKASTILEGYKKYFEMSDNEYILIRYFVYSSKVSEFQKDYKQALKLLEKANDLENNYDLRISYLAILCRDPIKANYHLKQFFNSWHLSSVTNRLLFYGVSYLYATDYDTINVEKYAKLYYAYQAELKYERIELDFIEIFNKIKHVNFRDEDILITKNEIFGSKIKSESSSKFKIVYEPEKIISLPKTYNLRPLSLRELIAFCENKNIELPIYYQLYDCKDKLDQPARFINGFLAKKIVSDFGNALPEKNDSGIIQMMADGTLISEKVNTLGIPNTEDWDYLHSLALKWCNLKEDKFNIVSSIMSCLNLNLEDRYSLLNNIRLQGIENFPRAIYYKVCGTFSDLSFAVNNKQYLKNQWSIANSLIDLLGERELPGVSACWGIDNDDKNNDIYCLLPLLKNPIIESSHPEMAYSDCIILLTKRIDDYLCNDKGQFN
ncbi:MAG TPA: NB-ARC domain-containing protein [Ignavibacteriaceae bacterium]|nr:NB-ARC domain-containing protein [Ignavibacteriaceae bacterium]